MVDVTFDADLRDIAASEEDLELAIEEARTLSNACAGSDKARHLSHLGSLLRLARRLPDARKCLEAAAMLQSEAGDDRGLLVTRVRLAHVLQWQKEFASADQIFCDCLAESQTGPHHGLTHFIHQHFGKSLFDQERYDEARTQFEAALRLRETLNDPELLESTRLALETTRMRLQIQKS